MLSGRKYITIAMTTTYCLVVIGLTIATMKKVVSVEVLLGVLGGFALAFGLMNEWYFKRDDRKKEE